MRKTTFIYALCDDDHSVRYIGKSDAPEKRLKSHMQKAKHLKTYKDKWMCSRDKEPILKVLEEVPFELWQEREMYWIRHYRSIGARLTNGDNGGVGGIGRKPSAETRAKMSAAATGKKKSPESIAKLIERNRKQIVSPATRAKISQAVKSLPDEEKARRIARLREWNSIPENRAKTANSKRGTSQSAETIEKRAAKLRGRKRPPEAMAGAQAANIGRVKTPEERAKISASLKGKKPSQEAIAKRLAAYRITIQKRKEAVIQEGV